MPGRGRLRPRARRPIIAAGVEQDRAPVAILRSLSRGPGHAARQYGIVDADIDAAAISFTGGSAFA